MSPTRRYRLRGSIGPRDRSYLLSAGVTRIGSGEENDMVLAVAGISRRHARLSYDGAELLELQDLESLNGTFVNGRPLQGGRVRAGDELRFGPVALRLEEIDARDAELALVLTVDKAGHTPFPTDHSTVAVDPATAEAPPRGEGRLVFPAGYVPGRSAVMESLHQAMEVSLAGDLPVLIEGETGVGKELVARTLHLSSKPSRGPFVAVNCAAVPSDLLEAEMFGIGEGVATGVKKRAGKFRAAQGGTLFLDEIGEMPSDFQAKLLRALRARRSSG